ncbi:MAG: hypothetical protein JWM74_4978 [Myxococcaceae bacterium]|nr:hypothetical protein [Myxococcaceae bacterium]
MSLLGFSIPQRPTPLFLRSNLHKKGLLLAVLTGVIAVAGGAWCSRSAEAGPVRGKITGQDKLLPDVYVEAAKPDAHRYTWREPSPTVKAEFRNLSANPSRDICIAALTSGTAPPHEPILIKITGGHTIPTTIVIAPGTRLSFENHDPFPHRLYIVGNDAWKPEDLNAGAHREWTPVAAGKVEFRDQLIPSVRTYVVVDAQVADIAFPGRDGSFGMTLPAGDYVLKAFFNGRPVGKPINVAAKERPALEIKEPLNVAGEGG